MRTRLPLRSTSLIESLLERDILLLLPLLDDEVEEEQRERREEEAGVLVYAK